MEQTTLVLEHADRFRLLALHWASCFEVCMLLNSNGGTTDRYGKTDWLLAVDAADKLEAQSGNAFSELNQFQTKHKEQIFGFLSYSLKSETEAITDDKPVAVPFPELAFFKPRYVLEIKGNKVTINRNYPESAQLYDLIMQFPVKDSEPFKPIRFTPSETFETYGRKVDFIRNKIREGAFYELNFCMQFLAEGVSISPVELYTTLNADTQNPFSGFLKWGRQYLMCASPERFLAGRNGKLIAQPIKGTARKSGNDAQDAQARLALQQSEKERAENAMIVDLMRNDLARNSKTGTVEVEELFGIHEFRTVIQMISTVVSEMKATVSPAEVIRDAFPMGSMTGAPKIEVMKTIDAVEPFGRGLFSGAMGYLGPGLDFDFNVVIRSFQYHEAAQRLVFHAGGAITYDSNPEEEYAEIQTKIAPLLRAIHGTVHQAD